MEFKGSLEYRGGVIMENNAKKLYSILKANGRRSYGVDWIKKNSGMTPDEANDAAKVLEREG